MRWWRALLTVALALVCCGWATHGYQLPGRVILSIGAGDQPAMYVNWLKNAGSTILNGNPVTVFDSNGYPNNGAVTAGVGITTVISNMPTLAQYGGTWEWGWSGQGGRKVQFTTITIVSDPQSCYNSSTHIIAGVGCDVVFNFAADPNGTILFPPNVTYSGMSSEFLIRSSDKAAYLAGLPLTPEFVAAVKPLNPLAYRTMGLSFINQSVTNSPSWTLRQPATATSYQNGQWFPNYFSASITGTDQYTASAAPNTPVTWTDGEILQGTFPNASAAVLGITGVASNSGLVQFVVSSTATLSTNQQVLIANATSAGAAPKVYTINVDDMTHLSLQGTTFAGGVWSGGGQVTTTTINVGGRGAKFVMPLGILGNPGISSGANGTIVYDGLLDVVLYSSGGLQPSVPIETQVAIANQLGKPLWWNIPPLWSAASVTSAVQYISANLQHDLYVEYANENWNLGLGGTAPGGQWYLARGLALGLGGISSNEAQYSYAGLKDRQLLAAVTTAWGRPASSLHRVLGGQAFGTASQFDTYMFKGQLLCGMSCGNSIYQNSAYAGVDYNSAPNRPLDFGDTISMAPYFGGCQANGNSGTLLQLGGIITAATQLSMGDSADALAFMDSDTRAGTWTGGASCSAPTLANLITNVYGQWSTVVAADGKAFNGYEGGYGGNAQSAAYLTSIGDGNASADATNIANLIIAYRNSSLIYQTVIDWNRQMFANISGAAGNSWLSVQGPGTWSLLSTNVLTQNSQFQTYYGVSSVNNSTNFLLKRDLDPAANDNDVTPAFVNIAA